MDPDETQDTPVAGGGSGLQDSPTASVSDTTTPVGGSLSDTPQSGAPPIGQEPPLAGGSVSEPPSAYKEPGLGSGSTATQQPVPEPSASTPPAPADEGVGVGTPSMAGDITGGAATAQEPSSGGAADSLSSQPFGKTPVSEEDTTSPTTPAGIGPSTEAEDENEAGSGGTTDSLGR